MKDRLKMKTLKLKIQKVLGIVIMITVIACNVYGQAEKLEYHPVTDPLVSEKLEQWQDYKFGLFMHWGIYCEMGLMASWHICNEEWVGRNKGRFENYNDFKNDY